MEQTNQNNSQTLPRIGEKAPAFTAVTTQGEVKFPEQFSQLPANCSGNFNSGRGEVSRTICRKLGYIF